MKPHEELVEALTARHDGTSPTSGPMPLPNARAPAEPAPGSAESGSGPPLPPRAGYRDHVLRGPPRSPLTGPRGPCRSLLQRSWIQDPCRFACSGTVGGRGASRSFYVGLAPPARIGL